MLLLAPLRPGEHDLIVLKKFQLVSQYINILITWRIWNFRVIHYSSMQYAMFLIMREIRGLSVNELAHKLYQSMGEEKGNYFTNDRLIMHMQNRILLHRILARITDYVETQSGLASRYLDYIREGKTRYEIEHIWANHADRHTAEFSQPADFSNYRDRIGGLLLLPRSFNASYGDMTYQEKLPHYNTQNLLARSLHPQCYERNPGFLRFIEETGLPFAAVSDFTKAELDARSNLYRLIADRIWNPASLLEGTE